MDINRVNGQINLYRYSLMNKDKYYGAERKDQDRTMKQEVSRSYVEKSTNRETTRIAITDAVTFTTTDSEGDSISYVTKELQLLKIINDVRKFLSMLIEQKPTMDYFNEIEEKGNNIRNRKLDEAIILYEAMSFPFKSITTSTPSSLINNPSTNISTSEVSAVSSEGFSATI